MAAPCTRPGPAPEASRLPVGTSGGDKMAASCRSDQDGQRGSAHAQPRTRAVERPFAPVSIFACALYACAKVVRHARALETWKDAGRCSSLDWIRRGGEGRVIPFSGKEASFALYPSSPEESVVFHWTVHQNTPIAVFLQYCIAIKPSIYVALQNSVSAPRSSHKPRT